MDQKHSLFDNLKYYNDKGIYPLHMPGHKRRLSVFGLSTEYDYTEVDGTDDLHHPEGILKDSMERTASVFGADRTWYLVNGSTCGNLAGVSAMCPVNGELIVARNCHRSVFHALEIRGIMPHWVYPVYDEDYGVLGGIDAQDINRLLDKYPNSRGVVITSPTYEGVVSDISSIASVCHSHGVPLFVDEAHGAHLGLIESAGFPDSAIRCGADLVVQSAHKTLIGLTQTAFLHFKSSFLDLDSINRYIDIYETSSPSYPLMMSLDACTDMVLNHGDEVFGRWSEMLSDFDEIIRKIRYLRVMCHGDDSVNNHDFFSFDKSKILINCRYAPFDGEGLMKILRERHGFELEMQLSDNALAMTGPGDDPDEVKRFAEALMYIDNEIAAGKFISGVKCSERISYTYDTVNVDGKLVAVTENDIISDEGQVTAYRDVLLKDIEQATTLFYAAETDGSFVSLKDAIGMISGEYIYCYPPGIPIIVPGERLDDGCISSLIILESSGYKLRYTRSSLFADKVYVIDA